MRFHPWIVLDWKVNHGDQCLTDPKPSFLTLLPGLPDEKGRVQILNIHTAMMRQHNLLSSDVDIKELAVETKNYSGAELEGLVRAAQSTAMNRHIKVGESAQIHQRNFALRMIFSFPFSCFCLHPKKESKC